MLMVQLSAEAEAVAPTIELLEAKVKRLVRQSAAAPPLLRRPLHVGQRCNRPKRNAVQRCNGATRYRCNG